MPALMPTPAKANTPVMGMEPPITMSSPPAWARAASGAARLAPAASSRLRRREEGGCCCIACLLLLVVRGAASIAEGPQVEQAAQAPPHLCQPLRSEEHTSELQSHLNLVCRLLLEKKKFHEKQWGVPVAQGYSKSGESRYHVAESLQTHYAHI